MKKIVLTSLLIVPFLLSSFLVTTQAAEKSLLDFEYGAGILLPIKKYDMKADNMFALTLNMSDKCSVTILREDSRVRGENSYIDAADVTLKYTIVNEGNLSITGIRILHEVPVLSSLRIGLDIANVRFNTQNRFRRSDGVATDETDWGFAATFNEPLDGSHPLVGLIVKWTIFSAEMKPVKTSLCLFSGFRFVDVPDTYALGFIESNATDTPAIDPIKNYHNTYVIVGLKIGF